MGKREWYDAKRGYRMEMKKIRVLMRRRNWEGKTDEYEDDVTREE